MNRNPQDTVVETDFIEVVVASHLEIAQLNVVRHPDNSKDPPVALVYACNRSIMIDCNETWNARGLL